MFLRLAEVSFLVDDVLTGHSLSLTSPLSLQAINGLVHSVVVSSVLLPHFTGLLNLVAQFLVDLLTLPSYLLQLGLKLLYGFFHLDLALLVSKSLVFLPFLQLVHKSIDSLVQRLVALLISHIEVLLNQFDLLAHLNYLLAYLKLFGVSLQEHIMFLAQLINAQLLLLVSLQLHFQVL